VVEQLAAEGLRARGAIKGGYFRDAGRLIVDVAAAEGADMVIIGSHGAPDLRGMAFGSVSLDVLKLSVVPVAVVPVDKARTRRAASTLSLKYADHRSPDS
jgi:nucleotide-binding universal stress UspA family protein